jgi:hypothetical protein
MGAKHSLAPDRLTTGLGRIITAKKAVPVQRFILAAAGTALLLERKSRVSSAWRSRTK